MKNQLTEYLIELFTKAGGDHTKALDWKEVSSKFESPLEEKFYIAFRYGRMDGWFDGLAPKAFIKPQYPVGRYRLDFLCGIRMPTCQQVVVGVEIDGHEFHEKTKEQAQRDKSRDRAILQEGIPVIRFTGSEVYSDPDGCAYEAYLALRCRSEG